MEVKHSSCASIYLFILAFQICFLTFLLRQGFGATFFNLILCCSGVAEVQGLNFKPGSLGGGLKTELVFLKKIYLKQYNMGQVSWIESNTTGENKL